MDGLAIKARMPSARPAARYAGVLCLNPACGEPMDVVGLWPETPGWSSVVALRMIVTLECPHCARRSTYCPKDLQHFDGQSHARWRAEPVAATELLPAVIASPEPVSMPPVSMPAVSSTLAAMTA